MFYGVARGVFSPLVLTLGVDTLSAGTVMRFVQRESGIIANAGMLDVRTRLD